MPTTLTADSAAGLSSTPHPGNSGSSRNRPTYVIGHRNPDADAICSAIAYAAYKDAKGGRGYVAARRGNSNARIDTILRRFTSRCRST